MSMSTHVVGIKPPDADWLKMKEVWDVCTEGGYDPPEAVQKFFGWQTPDPDGVQCEIPHEECTDEDCDGFQIEIAKIPPGVKIIRFYNSW